MGKHSLPEGEIEAEESPEVNLLFSNMDQISIAVATWNGMKQQFMDLGWSEDGAESLVIELAGGS